MKTYFSTAIAGILAIISTSCGNTRQPEKNTARDTLSQQQTIDSSAAYPMIITMDPVKFTNGFDDVPFEWNEEQIKKLGIQKITWKIMFRGENGWVDKHEEKFWTFSADGKPIQYVYMEDQAVLHSQTNRYKDGLLAEYSFTNHIGGYPEDITKNTYDKDGHLIQSRSASTNEKENFTYENGLLVKQKTNYESWNYEYENGKLVRITDSDKKWKKTFTHDATGKWTGLISDSKYKDSYQFLYNSHGQLKQIHWEDSGEPLYDIYFVFDEEGRILSIERKGYVPAVGPGDKMEFSYGYALQ